MAELGSSSVASTSTQPATPQFIQSSIPLPSKLDFKGNLAVNWKTFKRLWTNYEIASRLSAQSSNLRTATLLTCIGPDILEIYDGLPFGNEEEKTDIDKVIELLDALFIGETNEIYEAYLFNQRVQEVGVSFDVFRTALHSLAKTCNFGIMQERMIRDRVVVGIRDNATRKKLLAENKLTLNKCIDICRAKETTSKQLKEMSHAEEELEHLVKIGILQPVAVPTDWITLMIVSKKSNGKIRLCIDPKPLNKALRRNHFPLPVIDDLLPLLTNAKVFSVVDAKNRFWHVQLDDESSLLTTFGTPWGRFHWTWMPFGISPAPEEFQRRLEYALEGLDGIKPIFDDILVFGVGETEAEALSDHDAKLTALLERCRATGIKLNKEKLKLPRKEVKFMGHVICQDGLKPDPDKVQGIKEMPTPTSK
ncbi:Uncharacterized protein K02A2.6 [Stylophora pistillata]|uniref:Uncharacterized protein K02A2.6 n=1 Tax=Stylophora pistillata TaxID=50429 RepID=A0A2B4S4P6_STYPI|nr:Uncharacterized protein K02A2.6 [Stylophora pistillata]